MKLLLVLLTGLLSASSLLYGQAKIQGTVTTAANIAPKQAHVHLYKPGKSLRSMPLQSKFVESDGFYTISIDEPGHYELCLTATNHDYLVVPIVIENEEVINLNLTPKHFVYNDSFDQLHIIGEWNNFSFQDAEAMQKQEDGTYTYTLHSDDDEVVYQLLGLVGEWNSRSINAPKSNGYVYDNGGDYRSVLKVEPGEVTITFNPQDLTTWDTQPSPVVQFGEESKDLAFLWEINYAYNEIEQQVLSEIVKANENNASLNMTEILTPSKEYFSEVITSKEHSLHAKRYAALAIARLSAFSNKSDQDLSLLDRETHSQLAKLLPPSSSLWEIDPYLARRFFAIHTDDPASNVRRLLTENDSRSVKVTVLSALGFEALQRGDKDKLRAIYTELKEEYSDLPEVQRSLVALNPDRKTAPGNAVPSFDLQVLGENRSVSNVSMKGKYYLIDFWATWCGPCVAEMPELHAAYKKYSGENFEILSISFDDKPEKIAPFRDKRYPMPWLHVFDSGNFNGDLAKRFEVVGIPKPLLIDPSGTIVAADGSLRGEALDATLGKFLDENGTAGN